MATAWVAEMGDGDYVSHVELDADHPFATVVNGPTGDDLPGLFAWAREAADEVRLRIGDRTFSAGVEHVEGFAALAGHSATAATATGRAGGVRCSRLSGLDRSRAGHGP
jgi:hypothetical protein